MLILSPHFSAMPNDLILYENFRAFFLKQTYHSLYIFFVLTTSGLHKNNTANNEQRGENRFFLSQAGHCPLKSHMENRFDRKQDGPKW